MATTRTVLWSVVAGVALMSACDSDLRTENRQVDLKAPVFAYRSWSPSNEIVELSEVCPTYEGYRSSPPDEEPSFVPAEDAEIRACYSESLSGSATMEDGCILLDAPGRVTWDLERIPCDLGDSFGDDQLLFDVIALSETRAAFSYSTPNPDEVLELEVEGYEDLPGDYVAPPGEPIYIIEDDFDRISATLLRADGTDLVAMTDPVMSATVLEGDPSFSVRDDPSPTLDVTAVAGDAMQVSMTLPGGELDVGRVNVVSRSDIATLSLNAVVARAVDTDIFFQIGAVAVARDADGNMLREAPVTWSVVEGDQELYAYDPDEDGVIDPSPYGEIDDACGGASPGEQRSVVIEGTLDGFRETVRVEWDCVGAVQEGCSCRSDSQGPGWALWLLPLLGLLRRRR